MAPKLKATRKQIKESYNTIINVDYCGIQFLLKNKRPFGYTYGYSGWHCDFYEIKGVCICTGYNTMSTKKNPTISYDLCRKYDDAARSVYDDETLDKMLDEFIEAAKTELSKGVKNGQHA